MILDSIQNKIQQKYLSRFVYLDRGGRISAWFDDSPPFCVGVAVGSLSTGGMVMYRRAVMLVALVGGTGSLWLMV